MAAIKHSAIFGKTGTGKTNLALHLATEALRQKRDVVIFAPCGGFEKLENADRVKIYHDEKDFLADIYGDRKNALVIIDESDIIFPTHTSNKENHKWILQRGRHYGLEVIVISQRPQLVNKTVRNQCAITFVFYLNKDEYKDILSDYGIDAKTLYIPFYHFVELHHVPNPNLMLKRVELVK